MVQDFGLSSFECMEFNNSWLATGQAQGGNGFAFGGLGEGFRFGRHREEFNR